MRVYITGVAGFLGSHLADALLADGHAVHGCDNLLGGELENVPAGVRFAELDCCDTAAMRAELDGCEVLFHCAATAYEGLSVFSPALVCRNVLGASASVFSAAIDRGLRRVVFCSSMARYGAGEVPFREAAPTGPRDPYGVAKVAAEQVLFSLAAVHPIEPVVAVPHNIYGPRQRFDDPYRNVAAIMANRMLRGEPPIIYGDGRQERCFSHVDDCVGPLVRMATDPAVVGEVVNIGPDDAQIEIRTLASLLAGIIGFPDAPVHVPARPAEVRLANCSADKARRLLGYAPRVPLRDGLADLVAHIRARGPRPFRYHLPLEIDSPLAPETWRRRLL